MKLFDTIIFILVLLGGLNWTLVGLMNTNLFVLIFGETMLLNLIYLVVTIATVYVVLPRLTSSMTTTS
tara:strand:- start:1517 stop:1720 length:204 start_codon:yes stop_codon:yes gene_type:complete